MHDIFLGYEALKYEHFPIDFVLHVIVKNAIVERSITQEVFILEVSNLGFFNKIPYAMDQVIMDHTPC